MKLSIEIQTKSWINTADIESVRVVEGVERCLAIAIEYRRTGGMEELVLEVLGRDRTKAWAEVAALLASPTLDTREWITPEDYLDGQMDARAEILAEQGDW